MSEVETTKAGECATAKALGSRFRYAAGLLTLACVGAGILTGCKVGPNFASPHLAMPSNWVSLTNALPDQAALSPAHRLIWRNGGRSSTIRS